MLHTKKLQRVSKLGSNWQNHLPMLFCMLDHFINIVKRIDLAPDGEIHVWLNVIAADLGHRHKSDDFNSFLMHLFI